MWGWKHSCTTVFLVALIHILSAGSVQPCLPRIFSNSFTSIFLVGGGVHQASPVVCAFLYCQLFQAVSSASTSAFALALRQGMLLIPLPFILDAQLLLGASPLTLPFYVTAKKLIASTRWPLIHASKCRWLPFEFPVVPT